MDTINLNVDPIVLAAYAMKAYNQTHGLAYAHISQDFTIRQTSPNFFQFIKLNHPPIGKILPEILPPLIGMEQSMQDILDGVETAYLLEYVAYEQMDGSAGYLNIQITAIDEQNPPYGLLLLIEDVSRTGRLQQAIVQERNELSITQEHLKTANKQLLQLNQRKSLFMSIVAHDLRGPLSGIQGYASLLQAYLKDERLLKYVHSILSQVHRLNDMIGDLRDLDTIEENKIMLDIGDDNLNVIITEVVKAITIDLQKKGQTLHLDLPAEMLTIRADIAKFWRIIFNLLNNAVKYTPKEGEIHLTVSQGTDNNIIVKVADNGLGMTEDEVSHLFDLYYRTGSAKKSSNSGSGLGLFIVKGLVEAHNGRIEVVSQPKKGSTFTVYLPILAD